MPNRVVKSVEWAIENSAKDMKEAHIEVVLVMEELVTVAWKMMVETMLLLETPVATTAAAAVKTRTGAEIVVPLPDQNLELPSFTFLKSEEAHCASSPCNRVPQKDAFRS